MRIIFLEDWRGSEKVNCVEVTPERYALLLKLGAPVMSIDPHVDRSGTDSGTDPSAHKQPAASEEKSAKKTRTKSGGSRARGGSKPADT